MYTNPIPGIHFDETASVMEISLEGVSLRHAKDVSTMFDWVEDRITETGSNHWYFLIDMRGLQIDTAQWGIWAYRGKALNLGHSLGTVRYGAPAELADHIERTAKAEGFEPNLCTTRSSALAQLANLRNLPRVETEHQRNFRFHDLYPRITFDTHAQIMEADLSDLILYHPLDANDLYDHIEARIACLTPPFQWYFLINYHNTRIRSAAQVVFAQRGKDLNERYSLGSARYSMPSLAQKDLLVRSQSRDFHPNICETREAALQQIREMQQNKI